ncbi:hypothetical protein [Ornithinimicrobium sp. W1665]|uniref:hypothetical protein n=1 Tax=Ornithinimicrobium sp. W1665 TaxID=3416666 RepID=UPI003D6AD1EA
MTQQPQGQGQQQDGRDPTGGRRPQQGGQGGERERDRQGHQPAARPRGHGEAGQLDPLGGDRQDHEPDEEGEHVGHRDPGEEQGRAGGEDRSQGLHGDGGVLVAAPEHGIHEHEDQHPLGQQQAAEQRVGQDDEGERTRAEQAGGERADPTGGAGPRPARVRSPSRGSRAP